MKNRRKRIDLIIDIIKNQCVGSQDELADLLAKKGHKVTQATLSRDLKMLRTTKIPTDRGTYMYLLPDSNSLKDRILTSGVSNLNLDYQSGLISMAVSNNIVVIKTRNGYASGIAFDIDMSHTPEILGTIPGSDTIFAVLKEGIDKEEAIDIFCRILSCDRNNVIIEDHD